MNTEHAKQLLLKKEKALVADLDRLQGELTGPGDIGDPADSATTLEGEEEAGSKSRGTPRSWNRFAML